MVKGLRNDSTRLGFCSMDAGFGGADDDASGPDALFDDDSSLSALMCLKSVTLPSLGRVIYSVPSSREVIYSDVFKISLHPIFKLKHLQKIIIPSAWLGYFRDGLAQTSDEIVFRDVGKDKYRIELKKAGRGVWVDVENISLPTAKENESDDISASRGEALDGALLSRNTSAVSIFQENGYDIEANRGNARDGSGQNYRKVPLWEWIFVVSNLTVELPSAVFDQLSSPHKPLYALMAMASPS